MTDLSVKADNSLCDREVCQQRSVTLFKAHILVQPQVEQRCFKTHRAGLIIWLIYLFHQQLNQYLTMEWMDIHWAHQIANVILIQHSLIVHAVRMEVASVPNHIRISVLDAVVLNTVVLKSGYSANLQLLESNLLLADK